MEGTGNVIKYRLFWLGNILAKFLPMRLATLIVHCGAWLYYAFFPSKRRVVTENLKVVMGSEADRREVRKAFKSYSEYWRDFLMLPQMPREEILARLEVMNAEKLEEAVARGEGAIVALPHFGSWEAGAVYLSNLGTFSSVAEVITPPILFEFFCDLRKNLGINIFPYDENAETRTKLLEALRDGHIIALLCDRDLKGTGVEVNFFSKKATLPPGAASLALKSGSPIFCACVFNREDGTWLGKFTEPIYPEHFEPSDEVIANIMQLVAGRIESLIAENPSQWHMFLSPWSNLPAS
ncbi:MAG: hypothetical protein PHO53_03360 [Actinomycetota bacterium]|nr:hypothetical protein [Actinomycetota bacterium]